VLLGFEMASSRLQGIIEGGMRFILFMGRMVEMLQVHEEIQDVRGRVIVPVVGEQCILYPLGAVGVVEFLVPADVPQSPSFASAIVKSLTVPVKTHSQHSQ
jgi:hypothetical protein